MPERSLRLWGASTGSVTDKLGDPKPPATSALTNKNALVGSLKSTDKNIFLHI